MSNRIQTAKALTNTINSLSLTESFEAKFALRPTKKIEEVDGLEVFVMIGGGSHESAGRQVNEENFRLFIFVAKRIDSESNEEIESMITFTEGLIEGIANNKVESAMFVSADYEPAFIEEELRNGVFLAVIEMTYKIFN